jgi:ribonuclease HI
MQKDVATDETDISSLTKQYVGPIIAFTDGSCIGNGRKNAKGGYSVVFPDHPGVNSAWPIDDGVVATNNRAEFYGWLAACGLADKMDPVSDEMGDAAQKRRTLLIHTDSELLVKTVTTYISTWAKNGYVKRDGNGVANKDLVKRMAKEITRRAIKTVHVKAHTDGTDLASEMNRLADKMARDAAENQRAL